MEISQKGLDFIKKYEGCRLTAYKDIGGVITIGWGFTHYPNGTSVKITDTLTQEQADTMLLQMIKPYTQGIIDASRPLLQNELDALTSFAYNLGVGTYKKSTLCLHVNNNCVVESDFTSYDHVGTKEIQGLLNRRKAEYQLFISTLVQPIKKMEPTENVSNEISSEQAVPQTVTINSITVNYTRTENGVVVQENNSVEVSKTPEMLSALKTTDLVQAGWNVEII